GTIATDAADGAVAGDSPDLHRQRHQPHGLGGAEPAFPPATGESLVTRCPSNIAPATPLDILWLFPRMRADEQDQLDAFYEFADEREAQMFFLSKRGPAYTLFDDQHLPV